MRLLTDIWRHVRRFRLQVRSPFIWVCPGCSAPMPFKRSRSDRYICRIHNGMDCLK